MWNFVVSRIYTPKTYYFLNLTIAEINPVKFMFPNNRPVQYLESNEHYEIIKNTIFKT